MNGLIVTVPILLLIHAGLCAQLVIMRFFSRSGERQICRRPFDAEAKRCFLSTRLAERPS